MITINIRKRIQHIDYPVPVGVEMVYRSRGKLIQEYLEMDTITNYLGDSSNYSDACKNLLDSFNKSLRKGEYKRVFVACFFVYESKYYVKIKESIKSTLRSYHMGNGLVVSRDGENTIAHISPERKINVYKGVKLTKAEKAEIAHLAATDDRTISITQDTKVFKTRPHGK